LDAINRAYLNLIPKSNTTRTHEAFKPVSLQNCPIKAIAKVLANRLHTKIPNLIHADQMGFVKGRSISENFSYAANLQNCCHKCKAPTMVIKLDIRKDFDSVSWETLNKLLLIRGFLSTFCQWIQNILITCKTAILINGVPRTWIQCKKGLRQGDPISPYLYIIFSDILQQLILFFLRENQRYFIPLEQGYSQLKLALKYSLEFGVANKWYYLQIYLY
jgi:hypothetical protein